MKNVWFNIYLTGFCLCSDRTLLMFHSFVTAQMPLKVSLVSQCRFELGHELNIKC